MEKNTLLNNGYSEKAAAVAATADKKMDGLFNAGAGVAYTHTVFTNHYKNETNPQHGERGDNQTREEAQKVANAFMSSKIADAAARALAGDVKGALTDIGQASHTAQDIVRHDFESASQHPMGEPPATPSEIAAAEAATQGVLNKFADQLNQQGTLEGLTAGQIAGVMQSVQHGPKDVPQSQQTDSTGGQNANP